MSLLAPSAVCHCLHGKKIFPQIAPNRITCIDLLFKIWIRQEDFLLYVFLVLVSCESDISFNAYDSPRQTISPRLLNRGVRFIFHSQNLPVQGQSSMGVWMACGKRHAFPSPAVQARKHFSSTSKSSPSRNVQRIAVTICHLLSELVLQLLVEHSRRHPLVSIGEHSRSQTRPRPFGATSSTIIYNYMVR